MPIWVHLGFGAAAALAALLLVFPAAALARRWGVLDHPAERKIHSEPKPLLGGAAVFAAFYAVTFGALAIGSWALGSPFLQDAIPRPLAGYLANTVSNSGQVLSRLGAIGAGGVAVFTLGLFDDIRGLGVLTRLLAQAGIAVAVVLAGMRPELGFLPPPVAAAVAVLWVVGIMNAFNFIDGLDGEAAGVGAIAAGILAVAMARWDQPLVALLLSVLAGALAGFLRHNFFPSTIFLGSSGSLLVGYLLGVTVLDATFIVTPRHDILPIVMPVLVLGLPLYDMASVMVIRRLGGASVFRGDQNHLGHRLMRRGFTQKQAVLCIYLLTLGVAMNALLLPALGAADSLLILAQALAVLGVVILLERIRVRPGS